MAPDSGGGRPPGQVGARIPWLVVTNINGPVTVRHRGSD